MPDITRYIMLEYPVLGRGGSRGQPGHGPKGQNSNIFINVDPLQKIVDEIRRLLFWSGVTLGPPKVILGSLKVAPPPPKQNPGNVSASGPQLGSLFHKAGRAHIQKLQQNVTSVKLIQLILNTFQSWCTAYHQVTAIGRRWKGNASFNALINADGPLIRVEGSAGNKCYQINGTI